MYQYHPGGDVNAPKKDAPSALNVVIIPNVTLPKVIFDIGFPKLRAPLTASQELHEQYNKWGKDDF